jgi:hypothetical protein
MLLQKDSIVNTYDVSLEDQTFLLNTTSQRRDEIWTRQLSKDELINIHLNNIGPLEGSHMSRAPRRMVLPAAYAPSIISLNGLQRIPKAFVLDIS